MSCGVRHVSWFSLFVNGFADFDGTHNPKVADSNPAPATTKPPRFQDLGGFAFLAGALGSGYYRVSTGFLAACGSSGAAVCGAGGVRAWGRRRREGARGRGGR